MARPLARAYHVERCCLSLSVNYNTGKSFCQDLLHQSDLISPCVAKHGVRKLIGNKLSGKIYPYDSKTALSIRYCAENIVVVGDKVAGAAYCRNRWCPVCQWRRSLQLYLQNSNIMHRIMSDGLQIYMVTFTVRNVRLDALSDTLSAMSAAWNRMASNRRWVRLCKDGLLLGCQRTLECTYNPDGKHWQYVDGVRMRVGYNPRAVDTFHPHYHCIMAFAPGVKVPPVDWFLGLWQTSYRDPSISQLDVRPVDGSPDSVAEISKYVVKSSDLLLGHGFDFSGFPTLRDAFSGVRCFASSGIFRRLRAEYGYSSPDSNKFDLCDVVSDSSVGANWRWSSDLMRYSYCGLVNVGDLLGDFNLHARYKSVHARYQRQDVQRIFEGKALPDLPHGVDLMSDDLV